MLHPWWGCLFACADGLAAPCLAPLLLRKASIAQSKIMRPCGFPCKFNGALASGHVELVFVGISGQHPALGTAASDTFPSWESAGGCVAVSAFRDCLVCVGAS